VLPCVPLAKRVELLQRGSTLVKVAPAADRWKVAEGGWARHRYANKWVQLSGDARHVLWDEGRKSVDLSQVMRISIGIETRTLQRLYSSSSSRLSGGGIPDDVSSHHWFSLHTSSRSFDFGATQQNAEFGDENETVVLWVLTLQQLVASRLAPDAVASACLALSNAQYQWQRFDVAGKEWPCLQCTYHNPPDSPVCGVCTKPRPMVTVNPCLTPLLPALKAMDKTLGLDVFEDAGNDTQRPEAHLLWFLVQAVESAALPRPFEWAARCQPSAPDEHHLVMATYDGPSYEDAKHPYIAELRKRAVDLSAQLLANGGLPDFSAFSSPKFIAPLDSPHSSSADGESEMGTWRQSMANEIATAGFSQHEFEEALAAASLHEASQQQQQPQQQPQQRQQPEQLGPSASFEDAPGQLDAAVVFRHCMSGSIHELERFLSLGGHADTVYKSDYGWDVGPDWTFTKPNDGTTVLNYVATWSDVIGETAPQLAMLLLQNGADLERDDAQDLWFTPLHNAVANGASELVAVMLDFQPKAINLTTGDGRQPLHVLALCDDPDDRLATLDVLLSTRRHGEETFAPDLSFAEPFCGNTALHVFAKEGYVEVVVQLLEQGSAASISSIANWAGRTALEEARAELEQLDAQSAVRRSRLEIAIETMEIERLASL